MENNKDGFFDNWINMMDGVMNSWKDTTAKVSEEQKAGIDNVGNMYQKWFDNYQYIMDQMWQPVIKTYQEQAVNPVHFWSVFNPMYRPALNQVFSFNRFFDQYSSMLNSFSGNAISTGKTFSNMIYNFSPFNISGSKMYPHTVSEWYSEMLKTAQRSFSPFYHFNLQPDTQDSQSGLKMLEHWNQYMGKGAHMQFLLSKASFTAWDKVMKTLAERQKKGEAVRTFDEFYNEWSSTNEKEFTHLFHTKEYVMLQEELIRLQSQIARIYERQMEKLLHNVPVVMRSDMDEIYKSNHDLRARMNKLEKEFAAH